MSVKQRELTFMVKSLLVTTGKVGTPLGACLGKVVMGPKRKPSFILADGILIKVERYDCSCAGMKCVAIYPATLEVRHDVFSCLSPDPAFQMKSFQGKVMLTTREMMDFALGVHWAGGEGGKEHVVVGVATRRAGGGCNRCHKVILPRSQTLVVPWDEPEPDGRC